MSAVPGAWGVYLVSCVLGRGTFGAAERGGLIIGAMGLQALPVTFASISSLPRGRMRGAVLHWSCRIMFRGVEYSGRNILLFLQSLVLTFCSGYCVAGTKHS